MTFQSPLLLRGDGARAEQIIEVIGHHRLAFAAHHAIKPTILLIPEFTVKRLLQFLAVTCELRGIRVVAPGCQFRQPAVVAQC